MLETTGVVDLAGGEDGDDGLGDGSPDAGGGVPGGAGLLLGCGGPHGRPVVEGPLEPLGG